MNPLRYTSYELEYINKSLNNSDFLKFREQCKWARRKENFEEIRGAALMTRSCGLDFTTNFYYQKVKFKKEYKKIYQKPNFLLFLQDGNTFSLPRFPHSKIVIFDIDQRNNSQSINKVIKQLQYTLGDPFYIEYGVSRKKRRYKGYHTWDTKKPKGAHLYYSFNEYISDDALQAIEKKLASSGYIVEAIYGNKTIRLPMTSDNPRYQYFGYEVVNHRIHITDKRNTRLELYDLHQNFREAIAVFRNPKSNIVPKWILNINAEAIDKAKKCRTFNPIDISDIGSVYDTKKTYELSIDPDITKHLHGGYNLDHNPSRLYGNGTRHITQISIGFDVLRAGEDYNTFKQLCEQYNDGTSKDMKLPSSKKEKILLSVWEFCQRKFVNIAPTTFFYDPENYYHDEDFDLSESEYDKLERIATYYYLIDKWGKPFGKDQHNFIWNVIKMYTQIKQKALHDKYTRGSYTNHKFLAPLESGIALSQKLIKRIADYYDIKNRHRVIKFLKTYGFIEPVGVDIDGVTRYYSYKKVRFCNHFIVHTVQDIYNSVKRKFMPSQIENFLMRLEDNGIIGKKPCANTYTLLKNIVYLLFIGNNTSKELYVYSILYYYLYGRRKKTNNISINNVFKINIPPLPAIVSMEVCGRQIAHAPP